MSQPADSIPPPALLSMFVLSIAHPLIDAYCFMHRPEGWLNAGMGSLRERYPNALIQLRLRRPAAAVLDHDPSAGPQWRILCVDCPGKLYRPGPDRSLDNFEIHLKNRIHCRRVSERVARDGGSMPAVSPAGAPRVNHCIEGWLIGMDSLRQRYPDARIQLKLWKPSASTLDYNLSSGQECQWRVKCWDCPGKLYKPGPDGSMDNFETHMDAPPEG